ncbi:conserved exported hypothetical protein [Candidatus Nitrosotenuis uzonensis]|uniref:Uncharacterized protein n=2 Tax=Candidatus Nitrosotenuis uzonensis TaxID=1407055 RepID=A0A812EY54_9ARCH|nr:conserved exported hypothetical protein [Candidatus Nitrosotenuis uzonensis]
MRNPILLATFSTCLISILLFIPQGMTSSQAENIPISSDTVGGLSIIAEFKFSQGNEVVKSFKIFNQKEGYKMSQPPRETPVFQLIGGVGNDKPMLYYVTDSTLSQMSAVKDYTQFDVVVYLYRGNELLRELDYTDCMVSDYKITTLHDGDETFSGKTQFVIADTFEFKCGGYVLKSPVYDNSKR